MSTVFSEVYGTYYNVVAKVLTQALEGKRYMEAADAGAWDTAEK